MCLQGHRSYMRKDGLSNLDGAFYLVLTLHSIHKCHLLTWRKWYAGNVHMKQWLWGGWVSGGGDQQAMGGGRVRGAQGGGWEGHAPGSGVSTGREIKESRLTGRKGLRGWQQWGRNGEITLLQRGHWAATLLFHNWPRSYNWPLPLPPHNPPPLSISHSRSSCSHNNQPLVPQRATPLPQLTASCSQTLSMLICTGKLAPSLCALNAKLGNPQLSIKNLHVFLFCPPNEF